MVSLTTVSAGAVLLAAVFLTTFVDEGEAWSCAVGRPSCFVSCRAQKCATGYCQDRGSRIGTCVCSRCDNGPAPFAMPAIPVPLHKPMPRSNDPHSPLDFLPLGPQEVPALEEDFFSQGSDEDDVSNDVPDLDDALDSDSDLDDLLDLIPDSSEALTAALGHLPPKDLQNLSEDLESFAELVKSVLQEQQGAEPAADVNQDDERPESYARHHHHHHHHHHHSFWHHFKRFVGTIRNVITIVKVAPLIV